MSQKTVKRIFLFFIIYLPLQYAAVGILGVTHSEPWPAFVFPGFKSVYSTQGNVVLEEAIFYAVIEEEKVMERVQIAPSVLFEGLPASQLQGFLRSHFSEPQDYDEETKIWLIERLQRLFPGQSFEELQIEWMSVTYTQDVHSVDIVARQTTQEFTIRLE